MNQSSESKVSQEKHELHHLIIVDKSASMGIGMVCEETISGFNENLQTIKDADDPNVKQIVSIVLFDTNLSEFCWKVDAENVEMFSADNYRPSGNTALYDAVGIYIKKLSDELKDKIEARDANVVVTIFTDGQNNASMKYDHANISSQIEELRKSRMWTVAFLGCDEKSLSEAMSAGVNIGNTMNYAAGAIGTRQALRSMSSSRGQYMSKVSDAVRSKGIDNNAFAASLDTAVTDSFFGDESVGMGADDADADADVDEVKDSTDVLLRKMRINKKDEDK